MRLTLYVINSATFVIFRCFTVFFLILFAAIGSLLPYLALFMKEIGLTASQTGIIYGFMPFVSFLVKPVFGLVADKFQQHRIVLIVCCTLTGIFFNLIQLVPISYTERTRTKSEIKCGKPGSYIQDCTIANATTKQNQECPSWLNINKNRHHLSLEQVLNESSQSENNYPRSHKGYSQEAYEGSHQQFECTFDCHFVHEYNISQTVCFGNKTDSIQQLKCLDVTASNTQHGFKFKIDQFSVGSWNLEAEQSNCTNYYLHDIHYENDIYRLMTCPVNISLKCDYLCSGVGECQKLKVDNLSKSSFCLLLALLFLGNVTFSPILSLNDAISYDILGDKRRHKWGKQRLWGTIALALFAMISALTMDLSHLSKTRFNIPFYLYGILFIIMACVARSANISNPIVCSKMLKGTMKILRDVYTMVFLIVVTYFGFLAGSIEAFLFWFLEEDLGSSLRIIPGLCLFSNCLSETIVLYVAGRLIKRYGHMKCLYTVFVAYCIRFVSYSYLTNAWYVLPVELLNGLTFGLMWATVTSYGSIITLPGMSGTIQGLLSGLNFGLGK